MSYIRIKFPIAELALLKEAVGRFNDLSAYLDPIKLKAYKEHQVLCLPVSESIIFLESYLDAFPQFSKERIRKDLVKELEGVLETKPGNLAAETSLMALRELSF